uniref:Uncharacterized protein n=1 Tax=Anguilla anguilla TaxID=7936 RepID=A0A0E9W426_ANGAN
MSKGILGLLLEQFIIQGHLNIHIIFIFLNINLFISVKSSSILPQSPNTPQTANTILRRASVQI